MFRPSLWKHPPMGITLASMIRLRGDLSSRNMYRLPSDITHGRRLICGMRTLSSSACVRGIECLPNGIKITWDSGEIRTFQFEWLYRNRPEILLSCGQNSASPLESPNLSARSFSACICNEGRAVKVNWGSSTQSIFDSKWLSRFAQKDVVEGRTYTAIVPVPLRSHSEVIPSVAFSDLSSDQGILSWLEMLNRDGVCIVTDVPTNLGNVLELARRIGPVMRTIYGEVGALELPYARLRSISC